MNDYRFEHEWALLALLLIPAVMLWRRWWGRTPVWLVPYAAAWTAHVRAPTQGWRIAAVYAAMALITIAAARPQRTDRREEVVSRGYDLMLAIDLSTSMLAEDFRGPKGAINRLEAIRPILQAFVTSRPHDRIGVVVFAGRAYTLSPLTTQHRWLEQQLAALKIGLVEDGTAIGDGLGIALTNLAAGRDDESSVGAFVILLTDGANTSGSLTPPQATAIARHRKTPVYTIGAGRSGMVPFPIFDDSGWRIGTRQFPSSLDEAALQAIAQETGGRYLKAGDAATLASAFAGIDAARKTQFRVRTHVTTTELFAWAAAPALACLLLAAPGLRPRRAAKARPARA